ncbi:Uncharacterised protein [Bordetella ansorpii]|uniref:Lipoprotein n=1 Tax=Bordetella ansorpii TaxID=288768 RepID=A0A157SCI6_9BORD|nr:hypothetical protein [Bordetella ansorpii]SAI68150.1 Uncharacterised protein [Bordetella ansorpii]
MMDLKVAALAATMLYALAVGGAAAQPPATKAPAASQARAAKWKPETSAWTLWMRTCGQHMPDTGNVLPMMRREGYEENPAWAVYRLGGLPGHIWYVPVQSHQMLLVLLDNGTCEVFLRRGDVDAAERDMQTYLDLQRKQDYTVKAEADSVVPGQKNARKIICSIEQHRPTLKTWTLGVSLIRDLSGISDDRATQVMISMVQGKGGKALA